MAEPQNPTGLPGGDAADDEMARALKKAASKPRGEPDSQDIAADDAGASTRAEAPRRGAGRAGAGLAAGAGAGRAAGTDWGRTIRTAAPPVSSTRCMTTMSLLPAGPAATTGRI